MTSSLDIMQFLEVVQGIAERGFILSLVVASVYLTSRIIKFDNLSIEGAFGLGGACTAVIIQAGLNPWLALVGSAVAGALSGIATGLLNTHLKLNNLISGIVVTTGLFSVILKIAGSNMSFFGKSTIFTTMTLAWGSSAPLIILGILCLSIFILIHWFLKTEVGFLVRTVGDNPQMLTNVGKYVDQYIILSLVLSNILAALSGALFVQYTGYFSIWAGIGILIIGLAGMILAETLTPHFSIALIIGSIFYQAIIALTFELQCNQDWNKLITALLIVLLIVIKQLIGKK